MEPLALLISWWVKVVWNSGRGTSSATKGSKAVGLFYIFKVASCWNEFAHWSVLSGYKFWKPTLCNAVVHPWEIILFSTSKRNSAFKNMGSFNSDGQLCASVRLWRWSIAAVEISKALFDATVRLCSLCHGSSQQVLIRGMFVPEVILEDVSLDSPVSPLGYQTSFCYLLLSYFFNL